MYYIVNAVNEQTRYILNQSDNAESGSVTMTTKSSSVLNH